MSQYEKELSNIEFALSQKETLKQSYELCCKKYRKLQQSSYHLGFTLESIFKFDEPLANILPEIELEVSWNLRKTQLSADKLKVDTEIKNLLLFMELYWQQSDFINEPDINEREMKLKKFVADYDEVLQNNLWSLLNTDDNSPKNCNDVFAFLKQDVLFLCIQNLIRQIFFVQGQLVVLADRYFQFGNVAKCNQYFDTIYQHFEHARELLLGKIDSHGFIKEVEIRIDNVYKLPFIQSNMNLEHMFRKRLKRLNSYKKILASATIPIFLDQPAKISRKLDFSRSNVKTPISSWQQGAKVSYAIQCYDGKFYSKFSEWSEQHQVDDKAAPIIYLPRTFQQATRLIYRKFENKKPELVGSVNEPTQTFFQDIDRDLYKAAGSIDQDLGMQEFEELRDSGAKLNAFFEDGSNAIHAAAFAGNKQLIAGYLISDDRVDLNVKDNKGFTALHIASEIGYDDVVEFLLNHDVDPNVKTNIDELTPLHLAALKNNESILEALLTAESIAQNAQDAKGLSALHCAVFGGVSAVKTLIEDPLIDVNLKSHLGFTPLHVAVLSRNVAVTEALLRSAAVDFESATAGGLTAFHLAVILEDIEMINCLLAKRVFDINMISGKYNLTALHFAVSTGNEKLVSELLELRKINLNAKTQDGITPLHLAARLNLDIIIEQLILGGANINAQTVGNFTPLHMAALIGSSKVLEILVKHGANLELKTTNGQSALLLAANSNNIAQADRSLNVIKFLLEKGANMYANDCDKWNILHYAARYGALNVIKFLVEQKNFNYNAKNLLGRTPFFIAAQFGQLDIVKYFRSVQNMCLQTILAQECNPGIYLLQWAVSFHSVDFVKCLLDNGADIRAVDKGGWNLLHHAAFAGNLDVIKFLVEQQNFDPFAEDNRGECAVFKAAQCQMLDAVKYFVSERKIFLKNKKALSDKILQSAAQNNDLGFIKYLLENGADINAVDRYGLNLLHYAVMNGHLDVLKFFVEQKNFDVYAKDKKGETPLFRAAKYGRFKAVEYFVQTKKK